MGFSLSRAKREPLEELESGPRGEEELPLGAISPPGIAPNRGPAAPAPPGAEAEPVFRAGYFGAIGGELPYRARMERAFGEDFSGVGVRTGAAAELSPIDAEAATAGDKIAFASPNPDAVTVAHELAHVVQARKSGTTSEEALSDPEDPAEAEAREVASPAAAGLPVTVRETPSAAVLRQTPTPPLAKGSHSWSPGPPPGPPPTAIFDDAASWTAEGAKKALTEYKTLSDSERKTVFKLCYPTGNVGKVLKALPAEEAAGSFRDIVRDLLRRVEEEEVRGALKKTDEEIASVQATHVQAEAEAEAKKSLKRSPTTAEIEAARQKKLETTAYQGAKDKTRWEKLGVDEQNKWKAKATAAIAKAVSHATAKHPDLKLTPAHLKQAFHELDTIAVGALGAAGEDGGRRVVLIGFEFVEAVNLDPAYAMPTIVHELFGHPEFDDPVNYHLALFQKAGTKIPGYTSDAVTEQATYAYHASEIHSELRDLPYFSPSDPKHPRAPFLNPQPKEAIRRQVREIKKEWDPSLTPGLMRGLYVRFKLDPRIQKAALDAFEDIIRTEFPAEAKDILK